jgi:DNA-directed RNA polymerase subunit RPC12/RpoP
MIGYRCVSCGWFTEASDPQDIETCKRCGSRALQLVNAAGMALARKIAEIVYCPACRAYHTGPIAPFRSDT